MNTIAIVLLKDLSVPYIYQSTEPRQKDFGGEWGSASQSVHLKVPNGLRKNILKGVKNDDGTYTLIEDETKLQGLIDAEWEKIRAERNKRLASTDWTMLNDAQLDDEKKASYLAYRKALRDVPQNNEDPFNPVWPIQPSFPKEENNAT